MSNVNTSAPGDIASAGFALPQAGIEGADASGFYRVEYRDERGVLQWEDAIENVWCLEGSEAVLTHALKGSSYTATCFLGLIESTGYGFAGANGTGVTKGALAGSITAVGGASPANGWNEAPSSTVATRGTPSFGTASSSGVNSDLVTSAVALSTLETKTIKGCFLIVRSKAGTASVATVGSTAGALLSCGLFTGGDQVVSSGGTLNVTYTARLTTV
jgi:hypothetical protein